MFVLIQCYMYAIVRADKKTCRSGPFARQGNPALRARAEGLLRFLRMRIGGGRRGRSPSSVAGAAGKEGVHTSESMKAGEP
jgi:hypothetical protein